MQEARLQMNFSFDSRSGSRAGRHLMLRVAVRIGGSALVLALLFHFLPVAQVWATLRSLPAHLWLLVLAGYLAGHLVGVGKWRLMVNLAGAGLSFMQAARCYFAGLFSNLLLPSIIGGDVIRAGLAVRLGRNKAGVLLGSLLDRILDMTVLVAMAAFGAVLVPEALSPSSRRIFEAVGALVVAIVAGLVLLVALLPARRFSYRMRRHLVRLREARQSTSRRPHYVFLALALGLVIQTSFVLLTIRIAVASSLVLPLRAWLLAWPLAKLSALAPITQAGIGVREAALAALLAPFGARPVLTVAVGLAWEAIIISGGLLAGLFALLARRLAVAQRATVNASSS